MKKEDEFAFPLTDGISFATDGMTKREYFAAKAMQAFISRDNDRINFEHLSDASVMVADALIKALEK